MRFERQVFERSRRNDDEVWRRSRFREQAGADETVLRNMTERRSGLVGVEVQGERRSCAARCAVGDQDVFNGLSMRRQMVPYPKRLKHPDSGIGERTHPPIEFGIDDRALGQRIGNGDCKPALGKCEPERKPDHPSAADHNVARLGHAPASHALRSGSTPPSAQVLGSCRRSLMK